jgi:hypothetical protein
MLNDYGMVSFFPMNIQDAEVSTLCAFWYIKSLSYIQTVGRILAQIDKANGYRYKSISIRIK